MIELINHHSILSVQTVSSIEILMAFFTGIMVLGFIGVVASRLSIHGLLTIAILGIFWIVSLSIFPKLLGVTILLTIGVMWSALRRQKHHSW